MTFQSADWDANVKRFSVAELDVEGELTGPHPIQAVGRVGLRGFFIHAKHSQWTFEMEDDIGQLPSDTGNELVFSIAGRWKFADDMSVTEAQQLVVACAELFLTTSAQRL